MNVAVTSELSTDGILKTRWGPILPGRDEFDLVRRPEHLQQVVLIRANGRPYGASEDTAVIHSNFVEKKVGWALGLDCRIIDTSQIC